MSEAVWDWKREFKCVLIGDYMHLRPAGNKTLCGLFGGEVVPSDAPYEVHGRCVYLGRKMMTPSSMQHEVRQRSKQQQAEERRANRK